MNFSKTTEYSLRILIYMAVEPDKQYSSEMLKDNLEIPYRYLRKQLTRLVKSGLLLSKQGKSGGYQIARPLKEITLYDIVNAAGEKQSYHVCFFGFETCMFGEKCIMHDKWQKIQDSLNELLKNTTLEELRENGPERFLIQHNLMLTKNV